MNTKYTDGNLNGCLFLSNPIKIPQTPNYKLLAKKLWGVRSLTTVLASCAPCGDINSRVSLRKMVPVQRKGWGEWRRTGFSFVLREFFHQTWIIRCLIRGFCGWFFCLRGACSADRKCFSRVTWNGLDRRCVLSKAVPHHFVPMILLHVLWILSELRWAAKDADAALDDDLWLWKLGIF